MKKPTKMDSVIPIIPGISTDISETELERIEADPGFQRMMRNAERDIRERKTTPMEEVMREARARRRSKGRATEKERATEKDFARLRYKTASTVQRELASPRFWAHLARIVPILQNFLSRSRSLRALARRHTKDPVKLCELLLWPGCLDEVGKDAVGQPLRTKGQVRALGQSYRGIWLVLLLLGLYRRANPSFLKRLSPLWWAPSGREPRKRPTYRHIASQLRRREYSGRNGLHKYLTDRNALHTLDGETKNYRKWSRAEQAQIRAPIQRGVDREKARLKASRRQT